MGLQAIIDAAERVGECDEARRHTFREEFEAYEAGETTEFTRTCAAIRAERDALDELAAELDAEEDNIHELAEYADFLTVEQAVEHRDQTVEKLEAHNEALREFQDAMSTALDIVATNLKLLEEAGPSAVVDDPKPAFERAYEALETHNEAVEGLSTNLTILNAYLQ